MSDNANGATRAESRKRGLLILLAVVVVIGGGYAFYWSTFLSHFENTDDAYVGGDVVAITSREPGVILAVRGDNTQSVSKGQVLVELDPLKANVDMQAAEAELAKKVRAVRVKFARVEQLKAQLAAAQITVTQAESDLRRRTDASDLVSQEDVIHARTAVTSGQANVRATQSSLNQALVEVEGSGIADNPDVMAAIAQVRQAGIVKAHMQLKTPVNGIIAQRTVQLGQQIAVGTPLMAVVPVDSVWVDANFKEVQIDSLRIGQPVNIEADVYGSDVIYHGKVAGIGAGSGAAFALLPPQNASGNWIKIVQRVPVRVQLDPAELRDHPLRIGLSVRVSVDVKDASGAPLGAPSTMREVRGDLGNDGGAETDQIIARILQQNGA